MPSYLTCFPLQFGKIEVSSDAWAEVPQLLTIIPEPASLPQPCSAIPEPFGTWGCYHPFGTLCLEAKSKGESSVDYISRSTISLESSRIKAKRK